MEIKTGTRTVAISLCLWRGGWDCGLQPDCFQDLEEGFPISHPRDEDGITILSSDADLEELISWWEDEVSRANRGIDGEGLVGLTQEEIDRGDEWVLSAD